MGPCYAGSLAPPPPPRPRAPTRRATPTWITTPGTQEDSSDEPAGNWEVPDWCPDLALEWADSEPNNFALDIGEEGGPLGIPEDCSMYVFGATSAIDTDAYGSVGEVRARSRDGGLAPRQRPSRAALRPLRIDAPLSLPRASQTPFMMDVDCEQPNPDDIWCAAAS